MSVVQSVAPVARAPEGVPPRCRTAHSRSSAVLAAARTAAGFAAIAAAVTSSPSPLSAQSGATPDRRPTVAVMPYFDNAAVINRADYESLGKGIADVLISDLSGNPSIRVVERDRVQQLIDEQNLGASGRVDKATAVAAGKLLGAQHMIFGGFIVDAKGRMRLDARAVNVETSEIEHVESVTDKADNLLAIISTLADKLNRGMKLPPLPDGVARPALNSESTKPGRWRDLILYARAVDADDKKDRTRALALYKDFLEKSPSTILASQRRHAEQKVRDLSSGS
jgi:TolB-like protein